MEIACSHFSRSRSFNIWPTHTPHNRERAHLHTEEPPEAPSMHVKDSQASEGPFLLLKGPTVLRRTSGFSKVP